MKVLFCIKHINDYINMDGYDSKDGVVEIYDADEIDTDGLTDKFFEFFLNANEQKIFGWRVYTVYHIGGKNRAVEFDYMVNELFEQYLSEMWIVH